VTLKTEAALFLSYPQEFFLWKLPPSAPPHLLPQGFENSTDFLSADFESNYIAAVDEYDVDDFARTCLFDCTDSYFNGSRKYAVHQLLADSKPLLNNSKAVLDFKSNELELKTTQHEKMEEKKMQRLEPEIKI
jgi:hypothetical protein